MFLCPNSILEKLAQTPLVLWKRPLVRCRFTLLDIGCQASQQCSMAPLSHVVLRAGGLALVPPIAGIIPDQIWPWGRVRKLVWTISSRPCSETRVVASRCFAFADILAKGALTCAWTNPPPPLMSHIGIPYLVQPLCLTPPPFKGRAIV